MQKSAISMYETNKNDPSDKVKIEIAKYLALPLDCLLGIIDEPISPYNEEKILLFEFVNFIQYRRQVDAK